MNAGVPELSPPLKRPLQFSLRLLLALPLVVVAFAAVTAWFGVVTAVLLTWLGVCLGGICFRSTRGPAAGLFAISAIAALLLPALYVPRTPSPRADCRNRLKQISLALLNYHERYGSLPPAYIADAQGRPMHSWRVFILPALEREDLYRKYRFDEPWDGPNNRKLHNVDMYFFGCPSEHGEKRRTLTNYLAVVGPGTLWPGEKSASLDQVTDGTANTIMVVECAHSGIHWMEPRDLHIGQMNPAINPKAGQGISSLHPGGALVGAADGHQVFLSEETSPDVLEALLTISGGEVRPSEW